MIWQCLAEVENFADARRSKQCGVVEPNPDHVAIVIHNYRWRLGLRARRDERRRSGEESGHVPIAPVLRVPRSPWKASNGAPHPDPSAYARNCTGQVYAPGLFHGEGSGIHLPPQEAPEAAFGQGPVCDVDAFAIGARRTEMEGPQP